MEPRRCSTWAGRRVQLAALELYMVRESERGIHDNVESDGFIRIRSTGKSKME